MGEDLGGVLCAAKPPHPDLPQKGRRKKLLLVSTIGEVSQAFSLKVLPLGEDLGGVLFAAKPPHPDLPQKGRRKKLLLVSTISLLNYTEINR